MIEKLDLQQLLDQITELALAVGEMQKENLGRADLAIERKSTGIDLVTEIDRRSEAMITGFIAKKFPDHAILAEEGGRRDGASEYLWVIDPLDGTTNYAQGLPVFAISIALQRKGEGLLGVVYAPVLGQMFTAVKGRGAWLNGRRLAVSAKKTLAECVLATGFPYDIANHPANNLNYFNRLVKKARGIRRMGAAAYDVAGVAAGMFDGFWELNLSPWDVAAARLMVEEAGGTVIPFRDDRKISIIAGNPEICQQILAEIRACDQCGC